jgi:uncharacterized SAM-binding protein YcdF (DUF218 family)
MKPRVFRRRALIAGIAIAAFVLALYLFRLPILTGLGRMLVAAAPPVHADVLVVLRGDETYFERTLTAASLFHTGYADRIYVSSALVDLATAGLRQHGLNMTSAQDNIVSILLQKNVPCDRIDVDASVPGGGTVGEARRLAAFMSQRKFSNALVVTSWFHTRRTSWIMNSVLGKSGKTAVVVVADGPIGPKNWWRYRYTSLTVLEEFIKLGFYAVGGGAEFVDDPPRTADQAGSAGTPMNCPQTLRRGS